MSKNFDKLSSQIDTSISINNSNTSLENFHNIHKQNLVTATKADEVKSPEQIAKEIEDKAGNLGYGMGRFLNKTFPRLFGATVASKATSDASSKSSIKSNYFLQTEIEAKALLLKQREKWPKQHMKYFEELKLIFTIPDISDHEGQKKWISKIKHSDQFKR